MAKSVADNIQDAILYDHMNILRLSVHERTKAEKMLLDLRRKIIDQLVRKDPLRPERTAFQQMRLESLYKSVDDLIKANFKNFSKKFQETLRGIADYTVQSTTKIINNAVGIDLAKPNVSIAKIKGVINGATVDGKIIGKWWDKQAKDFQKAFKETMNSVTEEFRVSYLKGESLGSMVDSMSTRGALMGLTVAQMSSLIRTSIVQVSNEIRNEVYQSNKDILQGIRFVAVLDKKTTLLCQSLDGSMWDNDGNPLEGTTQPMQLPPLHWNCRSTTIPILLDYKNLKKGNPEISDLGDEKRAALYGPVPAKTTYEEWFATLDPKIQKEILGTARFKLWERGSLSAADMIRKDGTPLTIKELRRKVEDMGL